jgi:hypothetical protein
VQELKGLNKLRQLIHAHLGGPAEYIMFGQEFGVVGGACCVVASLFCRLPSQDGCAQLGVAIIFTDADTYAQRPSPTSLGPLRSSSTPAAGTCEQAPSR